MAMPTPNINSCLKKVGGNLTEAEKAEIKALATNFKKGKTTAKEANTKAVEKYLDNVRGEYNAFEIEVTNKQGFVTPLSEVEKSFTPAPAGKTPAGVEPTPKTPEATPEEIADATPDIPSDEPLAAFGGINFRRGGQAKAEKLLGDEGMEAADVAPFIEPGKDGKVGAAEVRKAVRVARREAEQLAKELDESGAPDLEQLEAKMASQITARQKLFEDLGDDSEEAIGELLADIDEIIQNFEAMKAEIAGNDKTISESAITTSNVKDDVLQEKVQQLDPEEKKKFIALRQMYKNTGVTGRLADHLAWAKYNETKLQLKIRDAAKRERGDIDNEDKSAGVGRRETGATGRAMGTLESGPTTAGKGNKGVQSFLKKGKREEGPMEYDADGNPITTKGERRLSGKDNPTLVELTDGGKPIDGIEMARAVAGLKGWKSPIKFVVDKYTKTSDGMKLRKGDTAFYDPVTNKVYGRSESVDNVTRKGKPETGAGDGADKKAEIEAIKANIKAAIAAGKGDKSGGITTTAGELKAVINAWKKANEKKKKKSTKGKNPQAAIDRANKMVTPPEGHRIALMSTNVSKRGTAVMRVISDKQLADGDGFAELLRTSPIEDWYVGYVPDGVKSGRRSVDEFTQVDASKKAFKKEQKTGKFDTVPNEHAKPSTMDDLGVILVRQEDDSAQTRAEFDMLEVWRRRVETRYHNPPMYPPDPVNAREVVTFIGNLEGADWPKNAADLHQHIEDLKKVYKYLDEVAPNGWDRGNREAKADAIESIEMIFEGHDAGVVENLRQIINNLAHKDAPHIREAGNGANSYNYSADGNNIIISPNYKGRYKAGASVLAHEIGHWAYHNILTPADKLEFWEAMSKYYAFNKKGALLPNKFKDKSIGMSKLYKEAGLEVDGNFIRSNEFESPQEFFANQFMMWVQQKPMYGMSEEQWLSEVNRGFDVVSLWKRVTQYVKNIFKRMNDNDIIDPDMEPLFSKILPDPEEAARAASSKPINKQKLTAPVSKHIINHYENLSINRQMLNDGLLADDPNLTLEAATELMLELFRLAPDPKKSILDEDNIPEGGKMRVKNAFRPTAKHIREIRAAANELGRILGAKVEEGENTLDGLGAPTLTGLDGDDFADGGFQVIDMSPERIEGTMDKLSDFIWGDNNKFGAFDDLDKQLRLTLAEKIRDAEGTTMFDADISIPADLRETLSTLKQPHPAAVKGRRKNNNIKKGKEDRIRKRAKEIAKGKGEKLKSSGKQLPSLKGRSTRQLIELYDKHAGTKESEQIVLELIRQSKLGTPPPKPPTKGLDAEFANSLYKMRVGKGDESTGIRDLNEMLTEALESANHARANAIIWELNRRVHKSKMKKAGTPEKIIGPMKIQSSKMVEAVNREINDSIEGVVDGIPQAARLSIREALGYFTHRNPEMQENVRTLAYRMFNLMGRTAQAEVGNANLISAQDVFRLSRSRNPSPSATGVMADFTSDDFKGLRNDLRRLTVGLNRGSSNAFDLMHEVGHVLMRTGVVTDKDRALIMSAFVDASDDLKNNIMRRDFSDMPERQALERRAEEWFVEHWAQYLAERVSKGDVFGARAGGTPEQLELKNGLELMLDRVIESAAYMLNGLIGRKDIRQTFRRLTLYGDLFSDQGTFSLAGARKPLGITSSAAERFQRTLEAATPRQREKIDSFVGGGLVDESGDPVSLYHGAPNAKVLDDGEVVFKPSEDGNTGPGIYLTVDSRVANSVFAQNPTRSAWRRLIENNDELSETVKQKALGLSGELVAYRQSLLNHRGNRERVKMALQQPNLEPERVRSLRELLDREESVIDGLEIGEEMAWSEMMDLGVGYDPGVATVYARALAPFDVTAESAYTTDDSLVRGMMTWAYKAMEQRGASKGLIDDTLGVLKEEMETDGFISGQRLYEGVSDALVSSGLTGKTARTDLNHWIAEQGYDSISSTHTNRFDDGTRVPHQTITLIETPDPEGGWISPSNRVKHQEAAHFDINDNRLYYSEPLDRGVNSTMVAAKMSNNDTEAVQTTLLQSVEEAGTPREMTNAAAKMAKGRVLNEDDVNGVHQASVATRTLRSNSNRMRESGMNWLADYFQDFFPSVYNAFAQRYMPIRTLMGQLPDKSGKIANWARRSNPFNVSKWQPASHKRILGALRRGPVSRAYMALSDKEKAVANEIRAQMDDIHKQMKDEGVMVGHIENYMPQVWDVDVIKEDYDGFVGALTQFLRKENPGRSQAEAQSIADHMATSMINDDGLYVPPPVSHSTGVEGHLDFQRLIRTDEHPGMIGVLEPYMQNNLDYLLVKYFDGASKRLHQARNMGVNVHGFSDYLDIGQNGGEAIVRQLHRPKVFTKKMRGQDDLTGNIEEFTFEEGVRMPFDNEEDALNGTTELLRQYHEHGVGAARDYLLGLMPEKEITPTYRKRVEAIVHAIHDFEMTPDGRPKAIHRDEFNHAMGTLRTVQGKQVNPDSSAKAIEASRLMRAFNNITLLTYTTLTSLPDVVLPLIRSGSFRDWSKAMAKYATDPDYRLEIQNSGVAIENALHQRLIGMFGADQQGKAAVAQNAFFNATMLTPWTDLWRGMSGAVAYESFKTQHTKLMRELQAGKPQAEWSRDARFAHRFLRQYGLQKFIDDPSLTLSVDDVDVAKGLIKFANDTIFSPNPNDIPLWAQTPGGAIMFQLKSFPVMMGRLAKDVLWDDIVKHKNFKRPLYFAAFAPTAGMGAAALKDIVQARGGEEGKEAELRKRNAAKFFGFDEEVHGNEDDYLGWYLEGLTAAGGFGLIGEILHDVSAQADNGAYGFQRAAGALLGPTFGTAASAFNVAGGVKEVTMDQFGWGTSDTNSKERKAIREAVGRIPFVGGVKSAREAIVDFAAGEQEKSRKQGWGSGWS